MNTSKLSSSSSPESHSIFADAMGYWERRRIIYNFLLVAVVLIWIAGTWPHFRPAFTWSSLGALLGLAGIANLCYCAAYLADLPMQHSSFRALWQRWRWGLWVIGTLFAIVFANYWIADEIYTFVH